MVTRTSKTPVKKTTRSTRTTTKTTRAPKIIAETADTDLDLFDYGSMLDRIEKKYKLTVNMSDRFKYKVSSGLLVKDVILGGGFVTGAMYTEAGMEQTGKSTEIMHFLATQVELPETKQPRIVLYADAEGCVTQDTIIKTPEGDQKLLHFLPVEPPKHIGPIEAIIPIVSAGGEVVDSKLYYGGYKPITQITVDSGQSLRGYRHPVLVIMSDGSGLWKKIEDLKEGDTILTSAAV